MTIWRPGMRAACVSDFRWIGPEPAPPKPRAGSVHVVTAVHDNPWGCVCRGLALVGFDNLVFAACGFRPAVDGEAEIERLRAIADKPGELAAPTRVLEEVSASRALSAPAEFVARPGPGAGVTFARRTGPLRAEQLGLVVFEGVSAREARAFHGRRHRAALANLRAGR